MTMTKKHLTKICLNQLRYISEQQFDIRIEADGRWFHDGQVIGRIELVKLFASILIRDELGEYWLATPVERGRIAVDDVPFVVVDLDVDVYEAKQSNKIEFRTNVDDTIPLNKSHPIQLFHSDKTKDLRPYVEVRDGLLARLSRPVYYKLAEYAEMGPAGKLGVWSHKQFFELEL